MQFLGQGSPFGGVLQRELLLFYFTEASTQRDHLHGSSVSIALFPKLTKCLP